MEAIPKKMFEVNDIVKRYTNIHNEFFKSSWLSFIPGMSKPIDYGKHFTNLSNLAERLQDIEGTLKEDDELDTPFGKYVHGVLETVSFLRDMGKKKSQDAAGYSDQAFKDDTAEYNKLAANYRSLLAEFNKTVAMD